MNHLPHIIIRPWQIITIILLSTLFVFYLGFINFTEPTEIGIARNFISGDMWAQEGGWHLTPPWVLVAKVDTRQMRVTVTTTGRGYSAKLVQFNPKEWHEFVLTEGFRYYWWANRVSFNCGYDEEYRGIKDIFRGYAYGVKRYSFLTIMEDQQQ